MAINIYKCIKIYIKTFIESKYICKKKIERKHNGLSLCHYEFISTCRIIIVPL